MTNQPPSLEEIIQEQPEISNLSTPISPHKTEAFNYINSITSDQPVVLEDENHLRIINNKFMIHSRS